MYTSLYDLKREVTDYQISLLVCLQKGSRIVTNEGNHFRAWLETNERENKKVSVRKDVADNMLSKGLIKTTEGKSKRLFYYTLSNKAAELLTLIDQVRLNSIEIKLKDKLNEQELLIQK